MKNIRLVILLNFLILFSFAVKSQEDTAATGTGNWSTGGTWSGGVPVDDDIILIDAGAVVTIANGNDITLNNVTLVIRGELIIGNNGFDYSTLTLTGTGGIILENGATITDPSFFGFGNAITVGGVLFWGGAGSGGSPTYQDDFTATMEINEPAGLNNPLPVEMVSFTGINVNNQVSLEWQTASELNNEGFEVQKSIGGVEFTPIGFVNGNGTTNEINTYTYVDSANNEAAYYRLKQTDFDGAFEFSQILYIRNTSSSVSKISTFPNPTKGLINIKGDFTKYVLFDAQGREIYKNSNTTSYHASQEISKILVSQEAGVYLLKTQAINSSGIARIIKE